ncbi:MAG: rRNA pseudouridine synthase [Verrucomicrobiae bacterium]|nr:rRNA pseudouridine synthase [Verrucomicrobiae bacterium]
MSQHGKAGSIAAAGAPEASPNPRAARINAFLAAAGLASRRGAERLVAEGRVTLNGAIVRDLATCVDPAADRVECDGAPVLLGKRRYALVNKPAGYACTRRDPHSRRTVYDLLPADLHALAHAGRLDVDSEGMLLLSDDGNWIQTVTHPRHGTRKEYEVEVRGVPNKGTLACALRGVESRGETLRLESARVLAAKGNRAILSVRLREGRNREIRRLFGVLQHEVLRLVRVAIGGLKLGALKPGSWRWLTSGEVALLTHPPPRPARAEAPELLLRPPLRPPNPRRAFPRRPPRPNLRGRRGARWTHRPTPPAARPRRNPRAHPQRRTRGNFRRAPRPGG